MKKQDHDTYSRIHYKKKLNQEIKFKKLKESLNAALLDQFNKYTEQFNSQTKNSWEQLLKIVQASYVDSTQRTIETGAQAGPAFKTNPLLGTERLLTEGSMVVMKRIG